MQITVPDTAARSGGWIVWREGPIAALLLDRPEKRNAVDLATWAALPSLLASLAADEDVRVLLVGSATPGLFCAGADIGEMLTNRDDPAWLAENQLAIGEAQHALARFSKPVVAFIDGDCIGGGCALALACDIRVATPRARFGITPARLGIVYPMHDTKLLMDLVGPGQAKRLLFSGRLIDAGEARAIGLIEEVGDDVGEMLAVIAANSSASHRGNKEIVRRILDGQVDEDAATRGIFLDAFSGRDFREGARAFVEKRAPDFS